MIPDKDLRELDVPEPPLFFQAGPEEIDLDPNPSAMSAPSLSLLGAWSESYSRATQNGHPISFLITGHNEDGTFEGLGVDADQYWGFTIVGTLNGVKITFTKFSADNHQVLRYFVDLDAKTGTVIGKWGPLDTDDEEVRPGGHDCLDNRKRGSIRPRGQ